MSRIRFTFIILVMISPTNVFAFDYELLTLGGEAKANAGASVLGTLGAPAAVYNPANLSETKKLEPYLELSAISLKYQYRHPDFDQAELNLNLPIASYGLTGAITNKIKFGVFGLIAPANAQKIAINEIPTRQITEEATLVNIESNGGDSASYVVGTGFSITLGKLSLGMSAITMNVFGRTMLRDPGSNDLVIDINHDVRHIFGVAGLKWDAAKWLTIGATYQSGYSPVYSVKSKAVAGGSTSYKGFKGQQLKFAASMPISNYTINAELQYREHSKTHGDIFTFMTPTAVTDNYDTLSYIAGLKRKLRWGMIGYSFGFFPTYVGDGIIASRTESNTELKGNSFGNLDGISRQTHAISSEFQSSIGRHTLGLSYSHGTREMPEDTRGYGSYKIQSVILSLGSRITF